MNGEHDKARENPWTLHNNVPQWSVAFLLGTVMLMGSWQVPIVILAILRGGRLSNEELSPSFDYGYLLTSAIWLSCCAYIHWLAVKYKPLPPISSAVTTGLVSGAALPVVFGLWAIM